MRGLCVLKGFLLGGVFLPLWTVILGIGALVDWIRWGRDSRAFDKWIFRWGVGTLRFWGIGVEIYLMNLEREGKPDLLAKLRRWSDFENWLHTEKKFFQGQLILFKHGSFLDIFTLLALCPRLRFGAKKELFQVPVLGVLMKSSGTICVDRSDRQKAVEALKSGVLQLSGHHPIALAPEGRRVPEDQVYPFKSGPFHLMSQFQLQVQGVVIQNSHNLWPPGYLWPRGVCKNSEAWVRVGILPAQKADSSKVINQVQWYERFQQAWEKIKSLDFHPG